MGEVCADDRPVRRAGAVASIEAAAGQQGNSECCKEIAADDPLLHREPASVDCPAGKRAGANLCIPRVIAAGRRKTGDSTCGPHARDSLEPAGQLLLERCPLRLVVPARRQINFKGEDPLDANAEVHLLQPVQAGQKDGRSREQRQRERQLRGSERAADPRQSSGAGRRTRLLVQRFDWRGLGQAESRGDPERHGRRGRRYQREEQHIGIETDVVEPWQRLAPEGLKHANQGAGHGESGHTAKERQQETLDQELARESKPARAERGAYRELVHATGRPDEGEVGHVHAR